MCKLLLMTGITEGLVAQEFMRRMAEPMSRTNNHGIGYSAIGPDGQLFSERWLINKQFMDTKNVMTPEIAEALQPYMERLPEGALDTNYSSLGNIDFNTVRTVTMHTRFATCGREFANTHPFIYDDTSLVHNGVISNAFSTTHRKGLDVNKISSCDSEAALQTYLSSNVGVDPTQAKKWLDLLYGGWAFGILTRNAQGNRILDVVKGSSSLSYMEIEAVGKVFTTSEWDAKEVVKAMGLKFIKEPISLASDQMFRYDAITGEFLERIDIKPVYRTFGNKDPKTGGTTTEAGGTSSTPSTSSSTNNAGGEGPLLNRGASQYLVDLATALANDPDAMGTLPDIFTANSSPKNLKIDYRKVKKFCNDEKEPIEDRLEMFDMVHNRTYLNKYESLPISLREHVKEVDKSQGNKEARDRIDALYEEKITTA